MSKEDWIILRLLSEHEPQDLHCKGTDHRKAGDYLVEKYGIEVVWDCFNQLAKETQA